MGGECIRVGVLILAAPVTLLPHAVAVGGPAASTLLFRRIGEAEGLRSSVTFASTRDHRDLLWIATPDGLHRYDGTRMRVYRHQPNDPTSIPSDTVLDVITDRAGRVWVATMNGVAVFSSSGCAATYSTLASDRSIT